MKNMGKLISIFKTFLLGFSTYFIFKYRNIIIIGYKMILNCNKKALIKILEIT